MLRNRRVNAEKVAAFSATLVLILFLILFIPRNSSAKVTGACSNCHTMHNSQGGSEMATDRTPNGTPPYSTLLLDTCVGCHSSSVSSTTYDLGGCDVPVVYFTGGEPGTYLAGGNYYWVKNMGNAYGHNPVGIVAADDLDAPPPGVTHASLPQVRCSGGNMGCHGDRFKDDSINGFHHSNDNEGGPLTTADTVANSFRGLLKVKGGEDPDWEEETTTNHNLYSGATSPANPQTCKSCHSGPTPYDTISGFCAACHPNFHRTEPDMSGTPGTQSNGQWIRHPTDILLPVDREYAGYPTYSTEAPVGYTDVSAPTRATAVVTCLSCHRAHGSRNEDMLRWNYPGDMVADGGMNTTGCFTCHTAKDDGIIP